jgi:hypothetical protein
MTLRLSDINGLKFVSWGNRRTFGWARGGDR